MKAKKIKILNKHKEILKSKNIIYIELENGLLRIDHIDFWGTIGKWFNRLSGKRGVGINSILKELRKENENE
mgnify:CR=1 FL=1